MSTKPDPQPEVIPPTQPIPQANVVPALATQITQVASYIPASAWTEAAVMDLHQKQLEAIKENNQVVVGQQKIEFRLSVIVLGGFAAVLATGFWFAYMKMDFGRDIVISAVSAGLGYAGGFGIGMSKRSTSQK
jgi:hypothetical protein